MNKIITEAAGTMLTLPPATHAWQLPSQTVLRRTATDFDIAQPFSDNIFCPHSAIPQTQAKGLPAYLKADVDRPNRDRSADLKLNGPTRSDRTDSGYIQVIKARLP